MIERMPGLTTVDGVQATALAAARAERAMRKNGMVVGAFMAEYYTPS
jgi:hypothetical protein